jgi:hypothetical protein
MLFWVNKLYKYLSKEKTQSDLSSSNIIGVLFCVIKTQYLVILVFRRLRFSLLKHLMLIAVIVAKNGN